MCVCVCTCVCVASIDCVVVSKRAAEFRGVRAEKPLPVFVTRPGGPRQSRTFIVMRIKAIHACSARGLRPGLTHVLACAPRSS